MTDDEITDLLFVCDDPIPADLAIVFGAAREDDLVRRTRRGVELYHERFVPRVLVTGGGVLARTRPEAVRMAELARALGVPESDLLVESRSNETFGNVRLSRDLLHERGVLDRITTVLLVSSEWHMRRVLGTVRAAFPSGVRLVSCPTSEGCSRAIWATSEACRREVLQELSLFQTFHEAGLLGGGNQEEGAP